MPRDTLAPQGPPKSTSRARLFALYRSECVPDEDGKHCRRPPARDLDAAVGMRLQQAAIASLSREIPLRRRIFLMNQSGWLGV
jgi:hypothetical protein